MTELNQRRFEGELVDFGADYPPAGCPSSAKAAHSGGRFHRFSSPKGMNQTFSFKIGFGANGGRASGR
ncbi:hypothetical protein [Methylocystis parvus]|uniref:hypothetical protein n=1 Tax=Methylocystis parvus TaxID=134 RepID=UPI003C75F9AD